MKPYTTHKKSSQFHNENIQIWMFNFLNKPRFQFYYLEWHTYLTPALVVYVFRFFLKNLPKLQLSQQNEKHVWWQRGAFLLFEQLWRETGSLTLQISPAKTRISLRYCANWYESSLGAWDINWPWAVYIAEREDSHQWWGDASVLTGRTCLQVIFFIKAFYWLRFPCTRHGFKLNTWEKSRSICTTVNGSGIFFFMYKPEDKHLIHYLSNPVDSPVKNSCAVLQ